MKFCIFSYNRGEFLENCVRSIERCAPHCPVHVFDDNSDDPSTRQILASLKDRHSVHQPQPSDARESKHGGLYGNMQAAYEQMDPDDVVCFIQDDTQLVRPVSTEEIAALESHFERSTSHGFVQPAFIRGCNRRKDAHRTRYLPEESLYQIDRFDRSAGAYYSDIFVARIGSLREVNWQFLPRESLNEKQARAAFGQMGYLRNPFAVWLPQVPAFRGKVRTLGLRWAEKIRRCGFYPVRIMDDAQTAAFLARDPAELPIAEDFLSVPGDIPKPWIYHPLQKARLLKLLHNLEDRMRKRFRAKAPETSESSSRKGLS